jgi:tellurite resistance protein TerC
MSWELWAFFFAVVVTLLAWDFGIFQRKSYEIKVREAVFAVALRVGIAITFGVMIHTGLVGNYPTEAARNQAGSDYFLAYLLQIALSLDNVIVFALVFRCLRVPFELHQRVLFWGIVGTLVMRAALSFAGIALVERFAWVLYIFALILIFGGVKMMRDNKEEADHGSNLLIRLICRSIPVTKAYRGDRFFLQEYGVWKATPLALVLVAIGTTCLIFAMDSVPAVLGITRDFFIVFTSTVFAILGLGAFYFALTGIMNIFRFLHYGLSGILIFIGVKMLLHGSPWAISNGQSLAVVLLMLTASISASLLFREKADNLRGA